MGQELGHWYQNLWIYIVGHWYQKFHGVPLSPYCVYAIFLGWLKFSHVWPKIETHDGRRLGDDNDFNAVKGEASGEEEGCENEEGNKKKKKKKDDFQPQPKLNLIVGFLRLANYVCAVNVIFGVAVSLFWPRMPGEPEPKWVFLALLLNTRSIYATWGKINL